MTEEQARKKRCCGPPGCGTTDDPSGEYNSPTSPNAKRWCIGSECMGWRETTSFEATKKETLSSGSVKKSDFKQITRCYCGKAGKP